MHFYLDGPSGYGGTYIGTSLASQTRDDLTTVCGGTKNHAFSFSIPYKFKDGKQHSIYPYVINNSAGLNRLLPLEDPTKNNYFTCNLISGDIVEPEGIDIFDYSTIVKNYGKKESIAGAAIAADYNVVDIKDYAILIANFVK